jgi:hypothetical protein
MLSLGAARACRLEVLIEFVDDVEYMRRPEVGRVSSRAQGRGGARNAPGRQAMASEFEELRWQALRL